MKRNILNKPLWVVLVLLIWSSHLLAQTQSIGTLKLSDGTGTFTYNTDALVDMQSNTKGMLLPRVALTATNSAGPLSAFTAGMIVYNTATAGSGATAVAPGYYYCDGTQWTRVGAAMTGATATVAGTAGIAPSPAAGYQDALLYGDATYDRTDRLAYKTLADFTVTGATIGTAATTVDVAGAIEIPQATANISLTLPNPTVTGKQRRLLVMNTGSSTVTVNGTAITPSGAWYYFWSPSANTWLSLLSSSTANLAWSINDGNGNIEQALNGATIPTAYTLATGVATVTSGIAGTLSGVLSGAGSLQLTGKGTLLLTGANTYTGATTVTAGTLQVGNGATGTITTSGATVASGASLTFNEPAGSTVSGTIANAGTVNFAESGTLTTSGVLSGAGAVNHTGSGTTTLKAANTLTGPTTVSAGKLYIGDGTSTTPAYGSGALSIASGATVRFNNAPSVSSTVAISNTFSGAGTLELIGNNIPPNSTYSQYSMTGNNSSFTGAVNITGARWWNSTNGSYYPGVGSTFNLNTNSTLFNFIAGGIINSTININDGAGWFEAGNGAIGALTNNNTVTYNGNIVLNQVTAPTYTGQNSTYGAGANGTSATFNGVLSGPGWFKMDMSLTSNSIAILNGINTFTGPIQLGQSGSVLQIGGSGSLGSGSYAGNIVNAGTFKYSSTAAQTLSGIISGAGAFTKDTGTGILTLSGANTYTGITTSNAGTSSLQSAGNVLTGALNIGASGTISLDGAGVLNNTGTYAGAITDAGILAYNTTANQTFSGVLSGAGTLTLGATAGTLTLTNANTLSGTTTVNGGKLYIGTGTTGPALGTGSVVVGNSGLVQWNNNNSTSMVTIPNAISGSGTVNLVGSNSAYTGLGNCNMSGNNSSFTGTINVTGTRYYTTNGGYYPGAGATMNLNSNSQLFNGNGIIGVVNCNININDGAGWFDPQGSIGAVQNQGTLTLNGNIALYQTTTSANTGGNSTFGTAVAGSTTTVNGVISGPGWIKTDKTAAFPAGNVILNGVNTFIGPIELGQSSSVLQIAGSGSLGAGNYAGNIVNAGTFKYSSSAAQTLSGVISGAGALTKNTSTSTLILAGANTYTGATTVSTGTLQIGNGTTGSISVSSATSTASGATLALNEGSGSTFSNAVSNAGNVNFIQSGTLTASGIISGTGSVIHSGTGTTTLTATNTYSGATTVNAGTLIAGSTTAFGSGSAVTINSGGVVTLNFNISNGITVNSGGVLNKNGHTCGTITNNGGTINL